jgi:hypothetical protein
MRMLIHVKIPNRDFNVYVKDGSAGKKMKHILEEMKPEAVYFTEYDGCRGAIIIADVTEPSDVPKIAEPWFLMFNAKVEFHIVMSSADLEKGGLDHLATKWA